MDFAVIPRYLFHADPGIQTWNPLKEKRTTYRARAKSEFKQRLNEQLVQITDEPTPDLERFP